MTNVNVGNGSDPIDQIPAFLRRHDIRVTVNVQIDIGLVIKDADRIRAETQDPFHACRLRKGGDERRNLALNDVVI